MDTADGDDAVATEEGEGSGRSKSSWEDVSEDAESV